MFIKRIDLVDLLETIDCENGYVDIDHLIECCNNLPSSGMSVWCMKCRSNGECMSIDKPNCFQMRAEPNSSEFPNNCETCKWGEWYRQGYDITMMDDECGGCCSWNSKWTPKDEPQTDCAWR